MKICLVHNEYGKFSGEEAVVSRQVELLRKHGHEVITFSRSSAELGDSVAGKVKGFVAGIYNPFTRKAFSRFLAEQQPDVVHVHNVFPLISPSIIPECRLHDIPVVMTLHNFRLVCPNALLARNGQICRECLDGHECRCVINNCEQSYFKSLGYAMRTAFARKSRLFLDNVDQFICLTEFQREIFVKEGFPVDRLVVIPNFIDAVTSGMLATNNEQLTTNSSISPYVLYVGRVSPEKDVATLLEAAGKLPHIPFRIAGSYWRMPEVIENAPKNVEFLGEVATDKLEELYNGAQMIVFATRCYEGFPGVILEAMAHAKPVVYSRIGGLSEIVEDNVHGLSYEPSSADDLTAKINTLWLDSKTCCEMGQKGRAKVVGQYGPELHYNLLKKVYSKAIERKYNGGVQPSLGRVNLGRLQIDGLTMKGALSRLDTYVRDGKSHYICFCEGSILSNIRKDSELVSVLSKADMVLPDGVGTMLLGRIYGHKFPERMQGPRFMLEVLRESQSKGYRHFFYGGTADVVKQLIDNILQKFPGCIIAGKYSPPFRELTDDETTQAIKMIEKSGADILWVALGSPRQEKWVAGMAGKIKVPVILPVGAAFDFHAGHRPWAPKWIRTLGLEWIFRMITGGKKTFCRNLFKVMPEVSSLLFLEFLRVRIRGVR